MKITPPPRGRLAIRSGIGLLLLFGFLAAYDYRVLHHGSIEYVGDASLLRELEAAPLQSALAAGEAMPRDWPQWRGPRRDGVSRETGLLDGWPTERLRVAWRASCGEGYSALAIAGSRAFTHDRQDNNETVVCWHAATGEEIWRYRYPASAEIAYGSGPRATPAVDGDRIYTVGVTGIMHCLRTATGDVLWRQRPAPGIWRSQPPLRHILFAPGRGRSRPDRSRRAQRQLDCCPRQAHGQEGVGRP